MCRPVALAQQHEFLCAAQHLLLKVWLPLAELSSSLFGSYAVYTINVAWDGGGHATVKRYSDFSGLHKSVCRHGLGPFVEFPSKVRPHACTQQRMHEYFTVLGTRTRCRTGGRMCRLSLITRTRLWSSSAARCLKCAPPHPRPPRKCCVHCPHRHRKPPALPPSAHIPLGVTLLKWRVQTRHYSGVLSLPTALRSGT